MLQQIGVKTSNDWTIENNESEKMCKEAVEACLKALTDSTEPLKFQASAAK
jgi:hypothetical protein